MAAELQDIQLESVSRRYDGKAIVDAVDLTLHPGELTAVLGASGAGKSTLLRLIAGLEPVSGGTIRHGGAVWSDTRHTVPAEHRRVGLVFQDFALFPHLSAARNVAFGLAHLERAEARKLSLTWMDRLGLSARADAYPHELSGGEQQRVAIARALAPSPVALLMDEPFSGLDPERRDGVRETTLGLIAETGVPALLVTHQPEEALRHADKVAVMSSGRLLQCAAPLEVYLHPLDPVVAAALGPVSLLGTFQVSNGQVETPLGPLDVPPPIRDDRVTLGLREGALSVDAGGAIEARITGAALPGAVFRVPVSFGEFRLEAVLPEDDTVPAPGMPIRLRLNPRRLLWFPA